jgi:DNA primase
MFIEYADLDRIKRLDLPGMMQEYGVALKPTYAKASVGGPNGNGGYIALCPFHDGKTPSLNLNIKGGMWVWHCFGCKAGGTVIDFVMKREGLSFIAAVKKLRDNPFDKLPSTSLRTGRAGGGGGGKEQGITLPPHAAKKSSMIDGPGALVARGASVDLDAIAEYYHKTLLGPDKRGIEYLARRGLKDAEIINTFKIGYANGTLKDVVRGYDARQRLRELGILSSKENESLAGCVTFAITDDGGKVVGLYGRSVEVSRPACAKASAGRHLYLKGRHKGVFNHQAAKAYKKIILTESIIDCLSIYKAGFKNVIPLYGTHGYTKHHHELLEKKDIRRVYLALDSDEAGEKACKLITRKLSPLEIGCCRMNWPPGIKDANQYFLECGTSESFGKLIAGATAMAGERGSSSGSELIDYQDGVAIFSVRITIKVRPRLLTEDGRW